MNIIIIGASSGIGLLMARRFAALGWTVGAAARRLDALRELQAEHPGNIVVQRIDVTDPDAPGQFDELARRVGVVDVYLHVSGILAENPGLDPADDLRTVETNVAGFTRMIDTAFHYFRRSGRPGLIAAITSVAGTKGIADLASYSASKRYQWTFLQALDQLARRERLHIRFCDIRPGWTRTPLIRADRSYLMSMDPEKVADAAVRAVVRRRRIAYIDCRWGFAARLWRLLPGWIWTRIPFHI